MEIVPYTYCNPYALNSKEKFFDIKGRWIKIIEVGEKGIGGKFWDCVSEINTLSPYY